MAPVRQPLGPRCCEALAGPADGGWDGVGHALKGHTKPGRGLGRREAGEVMPAPSFLGGGRRWRRALWAESCRWQAKVRGWEISHDKDGDMLAPTGQRQGRSGRGSRARLCSRAPRDESWIACPGTLGTCTFLSSILLVPTTGIIVEPTPSLWGCYEDLWSRAHNRAWGRGRSLEGQQHCGPPQEAGSLP